MRTLWIGVAAVVATVTLTSTGAAADRLVTGRDIKDGSVAAKDLRPALQKQISSSPRAPLAAHVHPQAPIVVHDIGPARNHIAGDGGTLAARLTLKPGTYMVTVDAIFDRTDDSSASTPILAVAFRGYEVSDAAPSFSQDVTASAGAFPATGDVQLTANGSRIVKVTGTFPADVYVFGTNTDGTTTGAGNYTADVDVSAVRVAN